MDLSAIALQGLDQASVQLDSAATSLVGALSASPAGANLDTVDLSAAAVALQSSKAQYSAQLGTLNVADHIQKSTIDLMA